jgi:peptidylprolyl isomerase
VKPRTLILAAGVALALALALAACGGGDDSKSVVSSKATGSIKAVEAEARSETGIESVGKLQGPEPKVEPPPGPPPGKLIVNDLRQGSGAEARTGDKVTIQFGGVHFDGSQLESSWEFGQPFRFRLGTGKLSPGWEKGIPGMRTGGRRRIIIPWNMVYPLGPAPDATRKDGIVYVVDLLEVS